MTRKSAIYYQIDNVVVRFIALQVFLLSGMIVIWNELYLSLILALDFAIRAFTYLPTPLTFISRIASNTLKLERKPIYAAPKNFAAVIGFILSVIMGVLFLFGFKTAGLIVTAVLGFFSFLEASFKICVGCYLYNWLVAPVLNTANQNKDSQRR